MLFNVLSLVSVVICDFLKHNLTAGSYGPRCEKTCLQRFANNTGADQPGHPHSLISAFVIRYLESIICKIATSEISIL